MNSNCHLRLKRILFAALIVAGATTLAAGPDEQIPEPQDWMLSLQAALKEATGLKIVIGAGIHLIAIQPDGTETDADPLLFETTDTQEIESLIQCIQIDPNGTARFCFCGGSPAFEFYTGFTLTAYISYHHGVRLRWRDGQWPHDGTLTDKSRTQLLNWLADHGITHPKEEYEDDLRREKELQESRAKFRANTPASLLQFFDEGNTYRYDYKKTEIEEMSALLAEQYPDEKEKVLALLEWYGSARGDWDHFNDYAIIANKFLSRISATEILNVTASAALNKNQMEGTARYWARSRDRKVAKKIPRNLKAALLDHSLRFSDSSNRHTARNHFGDFEYRLDKNKITLTGYNGTNSMVVIPDNFDSLPVTSIDYHTFGIRYYHVPEGEESCHDITQIMIPATITNLHFAAFEGCQNLETFYVDPDNPIYASEKGFLLNRNKTALIRAPKKNADSFINIKTITRLTCNAFNGCTNLTQITIPLAITNIEAGTFSECIHLKSIIVDDSNPSYSDYDGLLLNKDQTAVFICPAGRTNATSFPDTVTSILWAFDRHPAIRQISIPNGVTAIKEEAFLDCQNLRQVKIPASVTNISQNAFSGCTNLRQVNIPPSITNIKTEAFVDCPHLESVYFEGDMPAFGNNIFGSTNTVLYRRPDAKGWSDTFADHRTYPGENWGDQIEAIEIHPVKLWTPEAERPAQ